LKGMDDTGRTLLLTSQNVSALQSNHQEIVDYLLENQPSIYFAQEISISGSHYKDIGGYKVHYTERNGQKGGGVAIWVKDDLPAEKVEEISFFKQGDFESIAVKMLPKKRCFINIYRPPKGNLDTFFLNLEKQLKFGSQQQAKIFIAGDFNINLKLKNNTTLRLEQLLQTYNCTQLVKTTTRPNRSGGSLIDVTIISGNHNLFECRTAATMISDHWGIETFETKRRKLLKNIEQTTLCLSQENINKCKVEIEKQDWYQWSKRPCGLSEMTKSLTEIIRGVVAKICTKRVGNKRKLNPWYTKELNKQRQRCIKLQQKLEKQHTAEREMEYKAAKAEYKRSLWMQKKKYYEIKFKDPAKDPKQTWKMINELSGRKKSNAGVTSLVKDGISLEGINMANGLNDYFRNVPIKLAKTLPKAKHSFEYYLNNAPTSQSNLMVESVTQDDVFLALKGIKPKKGLDSDGISTFLLKELRHQLAHPLTTIFNRCIKEATWPGAFKIARVVPIPKKGNSISVENYRPISLLPAMSKVLERVVHKQIREHIETRGLLTEDQFGFRPGRCTQHAIMKTVAKIQSNLNEKRKVAVTLLDVSKAFDTVSSEILLQKLQRYGFGKSLLDLIQSYLSNRWQFVDTGGAKSNLVKLETIGVPQGSILGPLFFIIYINDLSYTFNSTPSKTDLTKFADDALLLHSNKCAAKLGEEMTEQLDVAVDWFAANKLSINKSKTELLLYGTTPLECKVKMKGDVVTPVEKAKYLGVILDNKLSFKDHMLKVIGKVKAGTYMLQSCKQFLPRKVRLDVFNALIKSHAEYCLPVWGNLCRKDHIKQLDLVLKKGIRMVGNLGRFAHTGDFSREMKILNLGDLIEVSSLKVCKQIIDGTGPPALNRLLVARTNEKLRRNIRLTPTKGDRLSLNISETFNKLPRDIRLLAEAKGGFIETVTHNKLTTYRDNCAGRRCTACIAKKNL